MCERKARNKTRNTKTKNNTEKIAEKKRKSKEEEHQKKKNKKKKKKQQKKKREEHEKQNTWLDAWGIWVSAQAASKGARQGPSEPRIFHDSAAFGSRESRGGRRSDLACLGNGGTGGGRERGGEAGRITYLLKTKLFSTFWGYIWAKMSVKD